MDLSVASVAPTGTASSTRSAPAAASKAEGASTSITPICRARAVVVGGLAVAHDALYQAGSFQSQCKRAAHQAAANQS